MVIVETTADGTIIISIVIIKAIRINISAVVVDDTIKSAIVDTIIAESQNNK